MSVFDRSVWSLVEKTLRSVPGKQSQQWPEDGDNKINEKEYKKGTWKKEGEGGGEVNGKED